MENTKIIEEIHKLAPLEDVLKFKNDSILYKFMESYNVTYDEAAELFEQVKKWLWLCARAQEKKVDIRLTIDSSIIMIDDMWHTFILFTKEYISFCKKYFGKYLHHAPTTKSEKDKIREEIEKDKKEVLNRQIKNTKKQYEFIHGV